MASLVQRKSGLWTAVFSHKGRRVWRSTGSKDRQIAAMIAEGIGREFVTPKNITLMQLWHLLIPVLPGSLAPGTIKLHASAFKTFAGFVGDIQIRAITPYDIERFKVARLKVVSAVKVSIELRALRASFNRAKRMKFLDYNPFLECENVRIPEKEPLCLSEEQLKGLMRVMDDGTLATIFMLAVGTGLRLGEVLSLRWDQMDLDKGYIALQNRSDFRLKNRRARVVPIGEVPKEMILLLSRQWDYVFCDAQGFMLKTATISTKFKKCVQNAGLPTGIHFHSLRHSNASALINYGVPLPHVQTILGHSSPRVTGIYLHQLPSQLRDSILKLDPMLMRVLKEAKYNTL